MNPEESLEATKNQFKQKNEYFMVAMLEMIQHGYPDKAIEIHQLYCDYVSAWLTGNASLQDALASQCNAIRKQVVNDLKPKDLIYVERDHVGF